jgi:excisionase family DNA binding protein
MTAQAEGPRRTPVRLVYSVEEAADLLGIGRTFMFQLVATGEIDSFKIGNRRKIPRDAIDGYIGRLRAEQAAAAGEPRGEDREVRDEW